MSKEYKTIQEVAGPLMLVRGVDDVAYDELGEIELANGEKRRCKVLEIDDGNALVQLYEVSTGINLESSKVRFLGRSLELGPHNCKHRHSSNAPSRSYRSRPHCRVSGDKY